jgi:predicted DNA-binding transcriptional regulator YafY
LFQIVAMLRRRRFMTAAQIAEELEISTRTVYRDVLDLVASGIPISGEAGVGYQLDPSHELPPLMFNEEEIEALVLGMRMVETWGDVDLRRAARGILEKVDAVLPGEERNKLNNTALFSLAFSARVAASKHLGELRQGVNQRRCVELRYQTEQGEETSRRVRPLGLWFWGRSWTLAAWCELRSDFRNFRTDRILELTLTPETFELVSPCTLDDFVRAMEAEGERDHPTKASGS